MGNMKDTYEFLKNLAVNNNREWFNANKEAIYQPLRKKWEADISRLIALMGEYDDSLRGLRVNDCVCRVQQQMQN